MDFVKRSVLVLFVVGILVTVYSLPIFHPKPAKASPKEGLGSIVRLVRDGRTFCSGVVVNDHAIITASHCVIEDSAFGPQIDAETIEIRVADNRPIGIRAHAVSVRIQLDQALLVGDFTKLTPRKYMTRMHDLIKIARYDQKLVTCAYPLGGPLFCGKMYFEDLTDFMWATRGLLLPGMSGGPVMLEDGTVVAINIAVGRNQSVVSPIYDYDLEFNRRMK